MRIGFDGRWYNDSGVGTYVAELLKALVLLQSRVQPDGPSDQESFDLLVYEDPKNPVPALPEGRVTRIALSSGKYSLAAQIELKRRCALDQIEVFHSPFYPVPLNVRCPIVVTIHDLIPFLFRTDHVLKRFAVRCGYRISAKRSRRIIAVSSHTANDIQRILGIPAAKITAVPNGVSRDFHPAGDPEEVKYLAEKYGICPPYIVAASAWNWQTKNLISALKALSLARSQSSIEFQTVVYGPPQGLQATGGASAWTNLNLVQTGHLAAKDLARLFRNACLFITPPLYEGFGLPLLEAMACGCAVIASNASSLPEVAGDGAQLFDPLDIQGMATAATWLLCNPAGLKLWRERALKRARDFSWSRTAQETLSVYHQALSESRAG